jgi:alpha-glucosidase
VESQTGDETSMLELYRAALLLRREHPALGDGSLTWLDTPDGVLALRREPGFVCVANLSAEPYELPEHTSVLLTSGPVEDNSLAPDQAAWLAV